MYTNGEDKPIIGKVAPAMHLNAVRVHQGVKNIVQKISPRSELP